MKETITSTAAGDIQLDEIMLIANTEKEGNIEVDLRGVFAELNLFEDVFSTSLYGNILIGDSSNLLHTYSIQGLEGLRIDVRTPGLTVKQRFSKTFGIYAITDQQILLNDRYQSFRLHFASLELLADSLSPTLNRAFKTKTVDIVQEIFNKYLVRKDSKPIPRNLYIQPDGTTEKRLTSDLALGYAAYDYKANPSTITSSGKDLKFIACNWSALKTIGWVVNRTISSNPNWGGSFVFYESNKAFHFTSFEDLIKGGKDHPDEVFDYRYDPSNLKAPDDPKYILDVEGEYKRVLSMTVNSNFNLLTNVERGLFGGQIRSIDPLLKRYREQNYSGPNAFKNHEHTTNFEPAIAMVPHAPPQLLGQENQLIDPRRMVTTRFKQPYFMYDNGQTPLISHSDWLLQRTTRMAELSNYRLTLLVNGRTDIKVGNIINFAAPGLLTDPEQAVDKYFNGYFLITAIRHFISPIAHKMTLEVVKDAFETNPDETYSTDPNITYFDP